MWGKKAFFLSILTRRFLAQHGTDVQAEGGRRTCSPTHTLKYTPVQKWYSWSISAWGGGGGMGTVLGQRRSTHKLQNQRRDCYTTSVLHLPVTTERPQGLSTRTQTQLPALGQKREGVVLFQASPPTQAPLTHSWHQSEIWLLSSSLQLVVVIPVSKCPGVCQHCTNTEQRQYLP